LQKFLQTFANFWSIYFILFYFFHVKEALANKMLQFQKSKMSAASIWKFEKPQYFCCGWTSLEIIDKVQFLQLSIKVTES